MTVTQVAGPLERADRERDVAPPDVEGAEREEPGDHGLWMADRLGQVQSLARLDFRFLKPPQLGQRPAQEAPGEDRGADGDAEAVMAPLAGQQADDAPGALDGALALPEGEVGCAEVRVGKDVDGPVAQIGRASCRERV